MKPTKYIALILSMMCVFPLLFSCTSVKGMSASDVKAGMTADELKEKLRTAGVHYAEYDNKILFANKNRKTVTVILSESDNTVTKVSTSSRLPDNSDFDRLKVGMTMPEVYELIGAPLEIPTSGFYSESFCSAQGDWYRIYWDASHLSKPELVTITWANKNGENWLKAIQPTDSAETTGGQNETN